MKLDWLKEIRPHQQHAVDEIIEAYGGGNKVVVLDAPTGSGKTLIADLVRQALETRSVYVCTTKTLQDQVLRDFPYAHKLMGRANYEVGRGLTADDCNKGREKRCDLCDPNSNCPYQVAKMETGLADVGVLNTAYWLRETNGSRATMFGQHFEWGPRSLIVMDECDTLESEMGSYIELRVNTKVLHKGEQVPKKGSHLTTIAKWIHEVYAARLGEAADKEELYFKKMRLKQMVGEVQWVAEQLGEGLWVRDNEAGPLVLKPVIIGNAYGQRFLWRHASKWLLMSGSVIAPDQMMNDLGIADDKWTVVRVPMTFPKENRPIIFAPVATITKASGEAEYERLYEACERIAELHPDDRILIHSVSYKLTQGIVDGLRRTQGGRVFTYKTAQERNRALKLYADSKNGILVAPSMARGYDFMDDLARVIVVAKVPYPSLGDKQVSARLRVDTGQTWYNMQTVRTLVQMTGRGVRSESDWCTSYILDAEFPKVLKRNGFMFPKWWLEAVDYTFPRSELRRR